MPMSRAMPVSGCLSRPEPSSPPQPAQCPGTSLLIPDQWAASGFLMGSANGSPRLGSGGMFLGTSLLSCGWAVAVFPCGRAQMFRESPSLKPPRSLCGFQGPHPPPAPSGLWVVAAPSLRHFTTLCGCPSPIPPLPTPFLRTVPSIHSPSLPHLKCHCSGQDPTNTLQVDANIHVYLYSPLDQALFLSFLFLSNFLDKCPRRFELRRTSQTIQPDVT